MLNWASSQATSVLCSAVVCWWKGIASSQLQRPAEMTCVEAVCRSGSAYNGDDVLYSLLPTRSSAALGKSWGCSSFLGHGRFSLQKERERERESRKKNRIVCKLENWKFRTNWYTQVNIKTSFKREEKENENDLLVKKPTKNSMQLRSELLVWFVLIAI